MSKFQLIIKSVILGFFVISLFLLQFFIPTIISIIIPNLINLSEKKTNTSPVEIIDIYLFIYYSLQLCILLLLCLFLIVFKKEYEKPSDTFNKLLKSLVFDNDNIYNGAVIEYILLTLLFLIIIFCIQIYRYIDNTMIVNSNSYTSDIPAYQYNYNPKIYSEDLKKNIFNTEKIKGMLNFSNILFICIPIVVVILIISKYILSNSYLLIGNNRNYTIIIGISIIIYIIVGIKSLITILNDKKEDTDE